MAGSLRPATLDDLDALIALGRQFIADHVAHLAFHEAKCRRVVTNLIVNHVCLLAEDAGVLVGALGLFVAEDLLTTDIVATEAFWYVAPEARGIGAGLLVAAHGQVALRGAVKIRMTALQANPGVGALYEKLGYTWLESSYEKAL